MLLSLSFGTNAGAQPPWDAAGELRQLVAAAGMQAVGTVGGNRERPHPRWFAGTGKVDEVANLIQATQADLLVANHDPTPTQQRNLEQRLGCRLITRTELILHIFADRARTREGQLQIELAQLNHARTRMARGWTHLDRQRGGVGLRGAGEKQIELDARMLRTRIKAVGERLQRVHGQRQRSQRRRRRGGVPTVALVGYTNAGKSTLFNALAQPSDGGALVADQLFATLDPLMRQVSIEGVGDVVLADTVGFIRDLPATLVEAFKATLEQVAEADLLLHVVDAAAADAAALREHVEGVLADIGAAAVPAIEVWNKIDLLDPPAGASAEQALGDPWLHLEAGTNVREVPAWDGPPPSEGPRAPLCRVPVSAASGTGLESLRAAIGAAAGVAETPLRVLLDPGAGKLRARLYALGAVVSESACEDGRLALAVRVDAAEARRLRAAGLVLAQEGNVPFGP